MIRILFGILASLGLLMALGTVLARNLVHAALYLVAFFFLVACLFVLLEAEFLAAMQVLVYIGAVAIILMFGIMLTRNIQGDETTGGHWVRKAPAAAIALALLAILVAGIADQKGLGGRPSWTAIEVRPEFRAPTHEAPVVDGRSAAIADMSRAVGSDLLRRFMIPFEIAGLLLTAALVGAIALAQSDDREEPFRLGASEDFRGDTTADPAAGGGVHPIGGTATVRVGAPQGGAPFSPASGTTQS